MKVEITPTENIEQLLDNLKERVSDIEEDGNKVVAELSNPSKLEYIPGIKSFETSNGKKKGIGGVPVNEQAYAKLESKRDVVKALLATIEGYDLRILNSGREWDIKHLKKYNPDIKHLKFDEPKEELRIEKSLSGVGNTQKVEIKTPEKEEEIENLYREMLT